MMGWCRNVDQTGDDCGFLFVFKIGPANQKFGTTSGFRKSSAAVIRGLLRAGAIGVQSLLTRPQQLKAAGINPCASEQLMMNHWPILTG
jgi:hypothetical protein